MGLRRDGLDWGQGGQRFVAAEPYVSSAWGEMLYLCVRVCVRTRVCPCTHLHMHTPQGSELVRRRAPQGAQSMHLRGGSYPPASWCGHSPGPSLAVTALPPRSRHWVAHARRWHRATELRVVMTSGSVFPTCFFNFPVVKSEE